MFFQISGYTKRPYSFLKRPAVVLSANIARRRDASSVLDLSPGLMVESSQVPQAQRAHVPHVLLVVGCTNELNPFSKKRE